VTDSHSPAQSPSDAARDLAAVIDPPDDITADPAALTEWRRLIAAIADAGGILKSADRNIIATAVRTHAVNAAMYAHVKEFGAIIKWPNGLPGPSPQYKAFKETANLLRGLLADLGATPAARHFDLPAADATDANTDDLEF